MPDKILLAHGSGGKLAHDLICGSFISALDNPLLGPMAFDAVKAALAGQKLDKKTVVKDQVFDQTVAVNVAGKIEENIRILVDQA